MKTELRKWNPFTEFGGIQNRLHDLFPTIMGGSNGHPNLLVDTDWEPAVDIEEDDHKFLITADLPEVKKEDIKVTIADGLLTISGERKQEEETKEKTFHRVERFHGSYQRSFRLPENVDEEKMDASLKDGALRVTLPKIVAEKKKPAREISVG
jgi:HSP20 family protein